LASPIPDSLYEIRIDPRRSNCFPQAPFSAMEPHGNEQTTDAPNARCGRSRNPTQEEKFPVAVWGGFNVFYGLEIVRVSTPRTFHRENPG
jgi:hypothetical protein